MGKREIGIDCYSSKETGETKSIVITISNIDTGNDDIAVQVINFLGGLEDEYNVNLRCKMLNI